MPNPRLIATNLLAVAALTVSTEAAPMIVDPGDGLRPVTISDPAGEQLSGIAYAGGSNYWAVSDSTSKLFKMNIELNSADGTVTSAELLESANTIDLTDSVGAPLPAGDREGVALIDANTVLISDESGPSIHTHDLTTGNRSDQITTGTDAQLGVFSNIRGNFGWESMTRRSDGNEAWTANEEALTVDGAASTGVSGTTVRLQKFDSSMTPAGQWAYQTDPITGAFGNSVERSGVSDLLVLDDGTLLVLERSLGLLAGFHIKIYSVDFAGATDVSAAPFDDGLIGESFTAVSKTLLWQQTFNVVTGANFEGLTLGPVLDDGSRSLLLISDNQASATTYVYPLKLIPEPATLSLLGLPILMMARRTRI